jgi:hypothetical protein
VHNYLNQVSIVMVMSFCNCSSIKGCDLFLEWGLRGWLNHVAKWPLFSQNTPLGEDPRVYPSDSEREFSSSPPPDASEADKSVSEHVSSVSEEFSELEESSS